MSLSGLMMKLYVHAINSKNSTTIFESLVILITWLNIKKCIVIKKLFRKLKASFLVNRLYQPLSSGYTKPDLKENDNEITSIENNDGILTQEKN